MPLHTEFRPHSFSGIKGQDKVVKILQNDVLKNNIKNAYCFTGVRGTGKTTSARTFAMAINCEHPLGDGSPCCKCDSCQEILAQASMDVFELDAASNNSVDDVRGILERVQYKPIHKKKVFILDECHMLSTSASNALLKVLEEPPLNVVFILCTTERHKVLPTIISRCSCFDFEKIQSDVIVNRLKEVCDIKGISYEEKALAIIANKADGGMRDALSILDKFVSIEDISVKTVVDVLGIPEDEVIFTILNSISKGDLSEVVESIHGITAKGEDINFVIEEIFKALKYLISFQKNGDVDSITESDEYCKNLVELAHNLPTFRALAIMKALSSAYKVRGDISENAFISSCLTVIFSDDQIYRLTKRVEVLESKLCECNSAITELNAKLMAASVGNNAIATNVVQSGYSTNPLDDMDLEAPDDDEADGVISHVEHREPTGATSVAPNISGSVPISANIVKPATPVVTPNIPGVNVVAPNRASNTSQPVNNSVPQGSMKFDDIMAQLQNGGVDSIRNNDSDAQESSPVENINSDEPLNESASQESESMEDFDPFDGDLSRLFGVFG